MTDALRTSPAREDLCRSAPFTLTRATDEGSDGLTIEGYGAVFGSVTRISGWEGDFEEVIAPGAFKKSLRERVPRMQFDHGQHPLLGSLPLGRWTVAEEDERGLHLVGRLTDNWLVTPFRDAIRDGGVEGMSFRFAVVRDEWVDAQGVRLKDDEVAHFLRRSAGDRGPIRRTLREVKASEAGPVVWPAYDDTAVGVRSRGGLVTIDLGRLHEPRQRREIADLVALADRATIKGSPGEITGLSSVQLNPADDPPRPAFGNAVAARNAATIKTLIDTGLTPGQAEDVILRGKTVRDADGNHYIAWNGVMPLDGVVPPAVVVTRANTNPEPVEATPPPEVPAGSPNVEQQIVIENDQSEPQTTAPPADNHPAEQAAPEVTDRAAGEHSAPTRPVNPVDRRELIRKEFRAVTNRVLALPRHQTPKENSA
jgi:HK97 family phage prohead protease